MSYSNYLWTQVIYSCNLIQLCTYLFLCKTLYYMKVTNPNHFHRRITNYVINCKIHNLLPDKKGIWMSLTAYSHGKHAREYYECPMYKSTFCVICNGDTNIWMLWRDLVWGFCGLCHVFWKMKLCLLNLHGVAVLRKCVSKLVYHNK